MMFGFDWFWLLFVSLTGAFPGDFVSSIFIGANYSGYLSIGLNPMTVVSLLMIGLFVGLLARNGVGLSSIFSSRDRVNQLLIKVLFLAGLISVVGYIVLGKLSYSLSLDNRYIGVGMLVNAIMILLGVMIKKGQQELTRLDLPDGIIIGMTSILAFFPGTSFLAVLFLGLRIRGFGYRAIGDLSLLVLMVNVFAYIISFFILFPAYFDLNGSIIQAVVLVLGSGLAGYGSTFGYQYVQDKKLPKLVAVCSFLAGVVLVFF